jgi:hypothetical protein
LREIVYVYGCELDFDGFIVNSQIGEVVQESVEGAETDEGTEPMRRDYVGNDGS